MMHLFHLMIFHFLTFLVTSKQEVTNVSLLSLTNFYMESKLIKHVSKKFYWRVKTIKCCFSTNLLCNRIWFCEKTLVCFLPFFSSSHNELDTKIDTFTSICKLITSQKRVENWNLMESIMKYPWKFTLIEINYYKVTRWKGGYD